MENQGPGLLACDEELFARVWGRVTAEAPHEMSAEASQTFTEPAPNPTQTGLVTVPSPSNTGLVTVTPPSPTGLTTVTPPLPTGQTTVDPTAAALQRWVLHLLTDGEAYRLISRRSGQNRNVLAEIGQEKQRGAKTLATEYFLRSGVRYWPKKSLQNLQNMQNQSFLPNLRALYLAERRQEEALRAQAAQEEPELANRYLQLADAARSAVKRLRNLLESLF